MPRPARTGLQMTIAARFGAKLRRLFIPRFQPRDFAQVHLRDRDHGMIARACPPMCGISRAAARAVARRLSISSRRRLSHRRHASGIGEQPGAGPPVEALIMLRFPCLAPAEREGCELSRPIFGAAAMRIARSRTASGSAARSASICASSARHHARIAACHLVQPLIGRDCRSLTWFMRSIHVCGRSTSVPGRDCLRAWRRAGRQPPPESVIDPGRAITAPFSAGGAGSSR